MKKSTDPNDYHAYYPEGGYAMRDPKSLDITGVIFTPNKKKSKDELDRMAIMAEESKKKPTHDELKKYPKEKK